MAGSYVAKVTAKGQITIPKALRDALHLRGGEDVLLYPQGEGLRLERAAVASAGRFEALAGRAQEGVYGARRQPPRRGGGHPLGEGKRRVALDPNVLISPRWGGPLLGGPPVPIWRIMDRVRRQPGPARGRQCLRSGASAEAGPNALKNGYEINSTSRPSARAALAWPRSAVTNLRGSPPPATIVAMRLAHPSCTASYARSPCITTRR